MKNTGTDLIHKMVLGALLSALVVVLQFVSMNLRFGVFSITLTLVPIVIGAACCGSAITAWLGFVFGGAVLLTGDAAAFMAISPLGTILTVLLKGVLCGLAASAVYKALARLNRYAAAVVAAIVCPICNTGVFLLGCLCFFMEAISQWAGGSDVFSYMIFSLVGINFLIELGVNLVLSPIIVRLLKIKNF